MYAKKDVLQTRFNLPFIAPCMSHLDVQKLLSTESTIKPINTLRLSLPKHAYS